jgi:hypothetical protein
MAEPRPVAGSVLHPATEGILDAAADFLWSDEMAESLELFSSNHADLFEGAEGMDVEEGEHRLEWTTAHKDFQQLFEFQLEQFVATQDFSTEEFVGACQDAIDVSSNSGSSTLSHDSAGYVASIVEMVLMTTTYNFFVRVMIAAANAKKLQGNVASMRDRLDEPEPQEERPEDLEVLSEVGGVE